MIVSPIRASETLGAMPPRNLDHVSIYSPLSASTHQIRLLTLTPSENRDDDIFCCLDVVGFQSSPTPNYEALSYVWGDPFPKFTIAINGHPFEICHNLYITLRYLRHRTMPRTLWIDALCINQSDAAEKDHQIRQMGAIYSNASKVLVWFGESDDDIEKAMDMLCGMERKLDLSKLDWYLDHSEPQLDWYVAARDDKSLHPGLNKLFNRPWFSRIWVVQEVSLSRRIPIILCGKRPISFKLLWDLKYHLALPSIYGNSVHKALGLDYETCSEIASFRARWNRSASHLPNTDEELLEHFLMSTSRRECTEPRDKVFGLLGLLSPNFVLTHFPDYNEPVAKIYQRTTKLLLVRGGLGWLRYAKNKNMSDLPSWCIDFSTNWTKNDRGFLSSSYFPSESRLCGQPGLTKIGELDSILVQGIKLGRVRLSAQRRGDPKNEGVSFIPTSIAEEMKLVEDFGETIRPFFAAVHTTLQEQLGDREACKRLASGDIWKLIGYGEDGLSSQRRDAERWASRLETHLWLVDPQWRATSRPWSQVPSKLTSTQLKLLEQGHYILDLVEQGYIRMDAELYECGSQLVYLIHCLSDCSFFIASDASNTYYGKADGMAEEDDVLCLLSGFNLPAILRHKQGSFKLVGFACVPSLSQPEEEVMYSDWFRLTTKHRSDGDLPLEDGENLEKREFRLI